MDEQEQDPVPQSWTTPLDKMSGSNDVPNCQPGAGVLNALSCGSGVAALEEGQTANTLFASLAFSLASFGAQIFVFLLLRLKLARIYRPRSYLVPEKERVPAPPRGVAAWLKPLFNTPNLAFIQKCGLDAYFFLRYLRMLLKIFVPSAVVILPILLPINRYSGDSEGLAKLSISNVDNRYKQNRLWAHLSLALTLITWVCYVVYRELRGYIRVRQAFLTSPQHRIKASATTVLVTGIPRKWLTLEALNGLYDVFPGGIRNIWINRNFDELADKVSHRNSLAKDLEDAETNLIKMCQKKHKKAEEQRRKEDGRRKKTKEERQKEKEDANAEAQRMAQGAGVSAGDQHDHPHGLQEALQEAEEAEEKRQEHDFETNKLRKRFGVIGGGVDAIGNGLDTIGKGVGKLGRDFAGDVDAGFQKAAKGVDQRVAGKGFVTDDELYGPPGVNSRNMPPTPPPKTPQEEREARLQGLNADGAADTDPSAPRAEATQHSAGATVIPNVGSQADARPTSANTQSAPSIRMTGPSVETKRMSPLQIEDPLAYQTPHKKWKIWKNNDRSITLPSPQPHTGDEDEFPLNAAAARTSPPKDVNEKPRQAVSGSKLTEKLAFWKTKKKDEEDKEYYPAAFNREWDEDQDGEPYWRRYLEPKERETIRVPIFSSTWCPSVPLVGNKVDRIYWLRRELARLNLEIEMDQNDVERFPFMNSAFIQFNHQVAAHMACQSVSHHLPQHMAPRIVEISPDDVLWDNLSVAWWERYLRSGIILVVCVALIILYAIPVTFTSLLSKLSTLAQFKYFGWIIHMPDVVINIIQGVLPPLLLALILALVPIIFRLLVKQQGVATGTGRELGVQKWYFAFLFIQVFLVVTITGGLVAFISALARNPTEIVSTLATNLPKSSTYFFSYLLIQALSNSASSLLQVGALAVWFLVAPIVDSTSRAKWRRQTNLANVTWGTFFPPFTNFAVIGLVYSVIAPLILVFMVIIFAVFWVVYRYNVLYVYQFRQDTGGLLFPVAVNQLFIGLYTLELCLVGFFFLARDSDGMVACVPHAAIMIVAFIFTVVYQWLLNSAFQPLFRYLPITLEDEAVIRDEEFARAQASKFAPSKQENPEDTRDIQDVLAEREQKEEDYEDQAIERERREIEERRRSRRLSSQPGLQRRASSNNQSTSPHPRQQDHLAVSQPSWHTDRWRKASSTGSTVDIEKLRNLASRQHRDEPVVDDKHGKGQSTPNAAHKDVEAQHTVGDVLFSGFADELEDLTPEERDLLVRYAFQHSALRAKRPVVWIPRDKLGVSDDEIKRARKMSYVEVEDDEKHGKVEKTNLWISNEGTALDGNGKVVFRRSPPDFSNVDLINL